MVWTPIQNLLENWQTLAHPQVHYLAQLWDEQRQKLSATGVLRTFLERQRRKIAIETGVIERLYTIDRGTTLLLIEHGIDESLIEHGATNRPVPEVVALIRDQEQAMEGLLDVVGSQRPISTSFVRQVHQLLTAHQDTVDGVDQFGKPGRFPLLKGDWKKQPNNPLRADSSVHTYAPPEQVAPQMDQLIAWSQAHEALGVPPEIEAAWLHHRFTQIHPFQDGNGRVARILASLVFLRAGWFPLVVTNDERDRYISALEQADDGNLQPLVDLFVDAQEAEFLAALSLSDSVLEQGQTISGALDAIGERLKTRKADQQEQDRLAAQALAVSLHEIAHARLRAVKGEIRALFHSLNEDDRVGLRQSTDGHADWYRYQIVETAKALGYRADLSGHKSWLLLKMTQQDFPDTSLLFAFHGLGQSGQRLMVCSACAFHGVLSAEGKREASDIRSLTAKPFQFSYLDQGPSLAEEFSQWLNEAVLVGLDYWRKGMGI